MTASETAPKPQKDLTPYIRGLEGWFGRQWPSAEAISVHDLSIPMATGFSNETVFFDVAWTADGETHERRFVARVEPVDGGLFPVQTPACRVSVELQHRIMEVVERAGVAPLPPLLPYEPDPSIIGQPFFVMDFVPGVIPADTPRYTQAGFLVDDATPEERQRMVENGLETLAGLHSIDWKKADVGWLDSTPDGTPCVAEQVRIYREYVETELRGRDHPIMERALQWLADNDPHDERIGLSWGDARLGNMIWQDYRSAAVVDWEACALLPTEADVGWWIMFDRMSHEDLGAERLPGFPTRDEMIAHYERASGREVRAAHYWEVFGAMRFCAIFIKLADRLIHYGLAPPDSTAPVDNAVAEAVERLLDNPY